MSLNLPRPSDRYDPRAEAERNALLQAESAQKFDRRERIEAVAGVVIKSPDGTRWLLTVSDAGVVGATAL